MATSADNLIGVTFRNHVVPDEQASKVAGRPIFSQMEVCDITFAANTKTKATFPAHDAEPTATRESIAAGGGPMTYAMVYNKQYLAFKNGEAQPLSGTPLAEAPFLTEAKRRELIALEVKTVEALAALDGTPLKRLGPGGRELKDQAQAYIDAARGSADFTAMAAEIAALRQQLDEERGLREEFTQQAFQNREAKKVERDVAKSQKAEARQQAKVDAEVQARLEQSDKEWAEQTEQAERGQVTASTDFDKWTDEQLKDYIASETGSRPKGNPKHETLVSAAKELSAGY